MKNSLNSPLRALLLSVSTICCDAFFIPRPHFQREYSRLYVSRQDLVKNVAVAKHTLLSIAAALSLLPPEAFTTPPMLEPPSAAAKEHQAAVSQVLQAGWSQSAGFQIPQEETSVMDDEEAKVSPSTYGEITELGSRQLFYYLHLLDEKEKVVFLDLGSGVGKLVVQAYMELPRLTHAMGIELSSTRHSIAERGWNSVRPDAERVRQMGDTPCQDATLELHRGDLFDLDVANVTHIYVASLCFSLEMMEKLGNKLSKEASALKCIATLKQFPSYLEETLGEPKLAFMEMTWTRPHGAQVYFYSPPRSQR
jgi:hypothetical protein